MIFGNTLFIYNTLMSPYSPSTPQCSRNDICVIHCPTTENPVHKKDIHCRPAFICLDYEAVLYKGLVLIPFLLFRPKDCVLIECVAF